MSCYRTEDRLGSLNMEQEPGTISQQQKVEKSDQDGERPRFGAVRVPGTNSSPRCMVFTYFKGDINSVVDEHFSRALRGTSSPIEICSKRKTKSSQPEKDEKQSTDGWNARAPLWSRPYQGPLSAASRDALTRPMATAHYRSETPHNLRPQPQDPWLLPAVSSQGLSGTVYGQHIPELHRMMPANRQYSSLLLPLQGARPPTGPSQRQTVPKTELTPIWAAAPPGLAEMGQSRNPERGFQHQEKRKDIYWY
ncbi:transcription cofactor vestigial-like protein 3 [Heptranchias perlo]|uniref:transcription cofactor vestigial-like protein 3 n=1 Tax=Heptranchias perlo TaxID=212740 RepID=UPI00355944B4